LIFLFFACASMPIQSSPSLVETLRQRRQRLSERFQSPAIFWSGNSPPRNFPANIYPFRASSHFLYFAGQPLPNAAIRVEAGRLTLFIDDPSPASILWHGESPSRSQIAEMIGADAAYPLEQLSAFTENAATIPVQDPLTRLQQSEQLHRQLLPTCLEGIDLELAKAIVRLRLTHDAAALAEIRKAAQVTVAAHIAGIRATRLAKTEAEVRAAMEQVIMANNMTCAYSSIVTVHGEVLHNDRYPHSLQTGDLLLADVGAETETGWAADVTRTWAVSGKFSSTQRSVYEVVQAAHDQCIQAARPGVEYKDLHLKAALVIAAGLVELGILRGRAEDLVEMDAHALFFPHGIGHLLGLDVHDMEDLGDLAGYEPGRSRSARFGLGYLRLDRPLAAGMVVTIEPGFYQVPAILNDPARRSKYQQILNWERLEDFADVRGIRIEDDILLTPDGAEILTAALPSNIEAIEAFGQG
jgi:Xaa-Pro aminopeptidase